MISVPLSAAEQVHSVPNQGNKVGTFLDLWREGIIQPSAVERRYALRHESTSALRGLRAILAQAVSERQAYLDEAQAVLQHYLPGTFFVIFLKSVVRAAPPKRAAAFPLYQYLVALCLCLHLYPPLFASPSGTFVFDAVNLENRSK